MGLNETDWPEAEPKPTQPAQWRAEIIDAILTNGLKPASLLTAKSYLGSVDRIPDTGVLGWFLKPAQRLPWQPHQIAANDLRAALYEVSSSSILPVISERPEEEKIYLHNPREIKEFVERTSTLFLVVCGEDNKGKRLVNYRPRSQIEERKYVFPASFLYLVFPGSISEEYLNPHFRTRTKLSIPFKTTSGVIT